MNTELLDAVILSAKHIIACTEIWETSGVSKKASIALEADTIINFSTYIIEQTKLRSKNKLIICKEHKWHGNSRWPCPECEELTKETL